MLEENLPLFILIVFGIVTFVELLYYYVVFARFSFSRKKEPVAIQKVPVSVIIVVKDAANALLKMLPKLLAQQYPEFEIVIVNDNSADETAQLILDYQQQYSNIKAINLDSAVTTIKGKKFALSMGITCASYEHVLITEPECCPSSVHWLAKMAQHFVHKQTIVLGYSTGEKRRNPANLLLHFDNLFNAIQYFSYCLIHSTYRGDGRNIAYTKSLFNAQRGFASHNHICCGEDDIFIGRAANKDNCTIEYDPDAIVVMKQPLSYRNWRNHKEGYYFTRKFYSFKNRFLLNNYALINLLFYGTFVAALLLSMSNTVLLSVTLGLFLLRLLSQYLVFGFAAHKLKEKQILPYLLFLDLIFAIMNPLYYLSAKIHRHRFA